MGNGDIDLGPEFYFLTGFEKHLLSAAISEDKGRSLRPKPGRGNKLKPKRRRS